MEMFKRTIKEEQVVSIKENTAALVEAASIISRGFLFSKDLSKEDDRFIRKFIHGFISTYRDPYKGYIEFCERILLSTNDLAVVRIILLKAELSTWFQTQFNGSNQLYKRVLKVRKTHPLYRHQYKAFAECVLEMVEISPDNYSYWIEWFSKRQPEQESMFFPFVLHYVKSIISTI